MSSAGLVRWGAFAAMVGVALSVLFAFVGESSWAHVPVDAARYAFLVVGVVGLYLHPRQSRGFGRLGAVGFYVCLFVFALVAILDLGIVVNEGVEQNVHSPRPGAGSSATGGPTALRCRRTACRKVAARRSVASHRRRAGQRACHPRYGIYAGALGGWLFIVATVLSGLGWAWLGYSLLYEGVASTEQPSRVR